MKFKYWGSAVFFLCFTGCLMANHYGFFKLSNLSDYQVPAYSKENIDSLKKFAVNNGYNSELGIFINLKKHSGSNRFFLINLKNNNVLLTGLCCHGKGKNNFAEKASFSNEIGGNYSSEGFYKIGYKYSGTFGTAYKLYGLSSGNSNAFKRFVVLHSHSCVPSSPVPISICQSLGCPTIAPEVLKELEPYLDESKKPVLLWIF